MTNYEQGGSQETVPQEQLALLHSSAKAWLVGNVELEEDARSRDLEFAIEGDVLRSMLPEVADQLEVGDKVLVSWHFPYNPEDDPSELPEDRVHFFVGGRDGLPDYGVDFYVGHKIVEAPPVYETKVQTDLGETPDNIFDLVKIGSNPGKLSLRDCMALQVLVDNLDNIKARRDGAERKLQGLLGQVEAVVGVQDRTADVQRGWPYITELDAQTMTADEQAMAEDLHSALQPTAQVRTFSISAEAIGLLFNPDASGRMVYEPPAAANQARPGNRGALHFELGIGEADDEIAYRRLLSLQYFEDGRVEVLWHGADMEESLNDTRDFWSSLSTMEKEQLHDLVVWTSTGQPPVGESESVA